MSTPEILVVDDEPASRRMVRTVLGPGGYRFREAGDGNAALHEVDLEIPDLVLLDAAMPGRDGYSVCRELKRNAGTRLIPVVMLTSDDDPKARLHAIEEGADDFINKPFRVDELAARVRSLLSMKEYTDGLDPSAELLRALALTVECRDRYTGNHCRRLAFYAERVGRVLGVDEGDLETLRLGGYLHDLGKIAVSDSILNKPGRLTPEEFDIMKTHAAVGADLCSRLRSLRRVVPLIRSHHEKLDGTGYPDGLRGGEIPLLVRIMSVVDVFDALRTKRSYKESLPLDRCIAILREEAARGWWDSGVVEALVRVLGETSAGAEERVA